MTEGWRGMEYNSEEVEVDIIHDKEVANIHYYRCFSITLRRFIKIHNIRSISKGVHNLTGKVYWVYVLNNELSEVLKAYTASKE